MLRNTFLFLCIAGLSLLASCAPSPGAPSIRLALEGPPLFIVAEASSATFFGAMDRNCMAGFGSMLLQNREAGLSCRGAMDHPANDKGRLYIELECDNGDVIHVVMRNLGPDQGMGVGRINETGDRITLFYHPSEDEARRRLKQLQNDIALAMDAQAQQTKN